MLAGVIVQYMGVAEEGARAGQVAHLRSAANGCSLYVMTLKTLLTASAVYQGIIGLGMMLVPRQFGIGAVPSDASPELLAFLRIFGGPMVGIAVLNWLARNAEPSRTRDAIVAANMVGFGCVALMDVWGVFSGDARPVARLFLVIHAAFAVAFIAARYRGERRT